jgi:hypothetical protein
MALKPRAVSEYHVFLASPGDMDTERKLVRAFFETYNKTIASARDLKFTVLDWETHATTGIGRAQALVTKQTLDRYRESLALVVGLMGQRFGAPTGTHESGTEEEFEWALASHLSSGFPEVKWFFRKIDPFVSSPDPVAIEKALDQWKKVRAFKARLQTGRPGEPTLLYKEFAAEDFKLGLESDLTAWLHQPARPWAP